MLMTSVDAAWYCISQPYKGICSCSVPSWSRQLLREALPYKTTRSTPMPRPSAMAQAATPGMSMVCHLLTARCQQAPVLSIIQAST